MKKLSAITVLAFMIFFFSCSKDAITTNTTPEKKDEVLASHLAGNWVSVRVNNNTGLLKFVKVHSFPVNTGGYIFYENFKLKRLHYESLDHPPFTPNLFYEFEGSWSFTNNIIFINGNASTYVGGTEKWAIQSLLEDTLVVQQSYIR